MRAAPSLLLALSAISLHVDVQASLTTASLISAKYGGSFSTALPKNDIGELIDSEITTCTSWGWSHYRTFDDRMYTYNGQCKYLLAQSPGKFNILVDNNRICPLTPCHRSIEIYFGDTSIKMTSSFTQPAATDVTWNGQPFKIPGSKSGSRFEKIGSYIIFRNPLGFSVKWDGEEYIVVELSTALKYEVTGLCGKYNGDPTDDFEAQNGQNLTSVVKFVSSWKQVPLMDTGPVCTDGPPTLGCKKDTKKNLSIEKASSKKCQALLFSQEFKVCHKFVPVERFYEACKMDCCDARGSECMCSTMEAYSRACARHRVIMDWRKTGRCEVHCGGGKVFRENGTTCEPDCLHTQAVCYDDDFVEGCFCPEGKVIYKGQCIEQRQCPCLHNGKEYNEGDVIKEDCNQCVCQHSAWNCTTNQCYGRCSVYGDGHIHTFDHSIFTFMGKCSYYMVRSPGLDIIISSKGCDLGFECSKSLKIMYMHKKIELYSDKRVFFNDSEILSLPFSNHEFRITEVSSLFLKLKLSNDFEVMWNGGSRIHIGAPPESKGTTKGLCGTFDGKQSNDFLTPQNIWESDPTIFGNKWITHKYCANAQVKNDPNPCDKQLQRKNEAHQHCSLLKSSVFAACHNVYEVEEYYKNCMIDMCTCEKNLHDCLCPTLGFYADACTAKGVYIDWRLKVDECKLSCPAGQAYQVCGRPCERTCLNYAQDQDCQKLCVEGCNCPDGNALNRNGECVPVTDCPCMFDGKEYRPGFTTIKGTELCVCGAAKWECQQITSNFTAQVSNLESLCGKNKEYKRCPDPCPDTCGNLDDTDSKCESSTACNEGCVCKPGFVLNGDECIQKESCPCTHGGKEYSDGEYFLMDCNKCTCKSHEWNCEQNECPGTCTAYGDSHYTTFDGLKYDFHGSCDYILAQSVGAQDRFEITIHNVPCGTSGVTCSKGINIIVGRERTTYYYNLHLVKGKKIRPPYGSPYVISDIGQMKYIQLPGGVSVEWDQGTRLYIRVPISFMNMTEGLCGNFNGDRNDDFTIRKNEPPASKATVFGDNWRLHSYCEPSMDIEESCELVPHRKPWATKECSLLSSELFEPCHGTVPHEGYLERCVFDACACDEGGGCECMCTAIAAYAHECASNGISIHWRTNEFCGLECSSCKEYNPCMSRCPKKTCENRLIFDSLTKDCEDERGVCFEGCDLHPCPDGQVYDSLIEPVTCIPETLCQSPSCKVGNKNYKEGERINDPTVCNQKCEICICRNGKIDHMTYGSRCEPIVVTVPTTIIPPTPVTKTTSFTPPPPVGCVEDGWTSWMSAVVPTYKNVGDKETEPGLRRKYSFCSKEFITNIKCQVIGQMPGFFFGQNVTCDVNSGLTCRHSDQDGGMCLDYEISFFCDCHKNITGFPTTVQTTLATESTTTPFIATTTPVIPRYPTPSCGWTPWMNSFTPDIGGDEESISNLRLAFSFCQHPIKILCRTVPDQTHPNGLRYDYAGQRAVTCNLNSGLICLNNVQQFGENCFDYEVMVQCIDACASTTEFSSKPTPSVGITVNTSSSSTGTTSSSTGSTLSSTETGGIGSTSIGTTMSSIGTTETTLSSTGPGGIWSSSTGTTRTSPASPTAGTASTTASPPTPVISSTTYTGTPGTTATPGVTVSTSTGSTGTTLSSAGPGGIGSSSAGTSGTTSPTSTSGTTTSSVGRTGTTTSGGNTGATTSGGNTGTTTSGGSTVTTTSGRNTGSTTSGGKTSGKNTGTTSSGGNTGTTPSDGNTGTTPSGGNTGTTTSGGNTGTTTSGENTGTTSGGNTGTTTAGGNTGTTTSGGNTGTTTSGENTGTTSGGNTGTTIAGGNTGTTTSGGNTGTTTAGGNTGTTTAGGNTGTTTSGGNTGTTTAGGNTGTTTSGGNTGTTTSGGSTVTTTSGRNTGTTTSGGKTSGKNTGTTSSGGNTGTTPSGGNTGTTTSGGNTGTTTSGENTGTTSGGNTGTTTAGGNTGTTTSGGNTGTTTSGENTGTTSGGNTGTTIAGGNTGTTTSGGNTGTTTAGGNTGTTTAGGNTGTTTSGGNTGTTTAGGNTGTTTSGGNTGTTTAGGNTGTTTSGGNTGTTASGGNTGTTTSGGNTGTTTAGGNTGTTTSGGNTGTTASGGNTGTTTAGGNTGTTTSNTGTTTSGGNTGTTPSGGNTGTTPSGGNTGTTTSGRITTAGGNTGTTTSGGNTGTTSGGNTGTTSGGNTGTTTSGGNTGTSPSGGNTGTTQSGGNTGTTTSGGNTGTTPSGGNTGTTPSGENTVTTPSDGNTGTTTSGENTGTTSGGNTGSTSGRNTGTTTSGGNTGTTASAGTTGTTTSGGNTGTTASAGNTGTTTSGGNTGTTSGGNTGTTTSGENTGSTSGRNTGTTTSGGNTGTTASVGNTGTTTSGGNTGTTASAENTGTTTLGENTGTTPSGENTGTTPSGENTGTTPSGGNTGTTSGGNTGTTTSGGNTGTTSGGNTETTSGGNTGTTTSGGNTGTTPSGENTGPTSSGGSTGTTPSSGNTASTSGGNTGTTSGGNTGTTTSGGNTGTTRSGVITGTTTSGGNSGTTTSGGNTGSTPPGGNTGTTPFGGNTGSTSGGNTGTTTSGGNTETTPSVGNTGRTPSGGNTGTTTSGGNTGTTTSDGNTGTTTSGGNTGTTPSGGNTGTTPSGGKSGTTTSGGNTGTTTSGGNTGSTSGRNTGTTTPGGNTGTTTSGGNTGSTPSGGNTGSTPSVGNTGTTTSGGNTGTTTSGGNTGTTVSSTGPGGIGSSSTGTIKTSPAFASTGTVRTTASPPTPVTSSTTYTGTPGTTGGIASTISVETPGVTVSTSTVTTGIISSSTGPGGIGSSSTGTTGTTSFSSSYTSTSSSKPSPTTSFGTVSLTPGSSHFSTIYTETTLGFTTTPNPPVTSHGKACDDLLGLYNPVLMGADHFLGTSSSDVAYDPSNARLNNHPDGPTNGGSWMPRLSDKHPELEIDLKHKVAISGVITQGQPSANQWVTKYEVFISKDGNTFEPYSESSDGSAKVFTANFDSDTPVKVFFNKSISVRKLKIHPTGSFNGIALRMDLLTCEGVTLPTTFQTPTPRHGGGDTTVTPTPALFAKMDLGFDCDSDLNVNLPSNVPDKYMTSYSYSNNYSHPSHGRLGNNDSAWIPNTNANGEWFEVDLQTPHFVTTVLTQGHPKKSRWVSSYYLAYSTDGHLYRFVKNEQKKPLLFSGNYDENKVVANKIPGMMLVRKLRIYPLAWPTNGIALRVDFKGCKPPGQTGSTLPTTTEEGTPKTTISSTGTTGTTVSSTGTTSSGGGTGPTLSGGSTGTTPSGGNTRTTPSGGKTGTTYGENTGTTKSGGNTGTTSSGGRTGTTLSGRNTGTTPSGENTGTTSGGNTGTTPSGGNTETTPSGGNTGPTTSGGNTGSTPSGGNTGTTLSGENTGTTRSGGSTGTTPLGENTGTTTSGGNTGTTTSGGNTGSTKSGGNTGTTPSGRNTGTTTSGRNTGSTPSGENTETTSSGGSTGTTPSGGNTGTTPSGENTGTTPSGRNTGPTSSGGSTGTTPSGENTGTTSSGGSTGTTPSGGNTASTSGGNTGTTTSGGNTGTTTSGGNTGTTPSGGKTGSTSSGGSTGTTPSGGNTGQTTSGRNTGSTSGRNTGTTTSGGNTGTTPSDGNTRTTSGGNTGSTSGRNTGTTTSGGNTGTTKSGENTGTTPSGRNTGTTTPGGNTGTTPSGGNTGPTSSGGSTGTTPSGENTGTTSSGGSTGTTPSGGNTASTSGGNTGTTTSGGNTGTTTSGGNTGTTPSGGKTGPTSSGGSTGTTPSGGNTGQTTSGRNTGSTSGGNTGTTTSGENTGTTTSGGNTGTTPSGGNTGPTSSGGSTGTTPSGGNTGSTTSGGNTGTTTSGGNTGTTKSGENTGTTPSGRNTGTTTSGGNTGTTPSGGNTGATTSDGNTGTTPYTGTTPSGENTETTSSGNTGPTTSGGNTETTPLSGNTGSTSGRNTGSTSGRNTGTTPSGGNTGSTSGRNTGTTTSGGNTGTTTSGGHTGTTPSSGNTGSTSGRNTGTTTSGGNTGTTSGRNTGTTPSGGNTGTTTSGGRTGSTPSGGRTGTTSSGENTGTTSGGGTETTPSGGNTGTTPSGGNTGTTPSEGNTETTPSSTGTTGTRPPCIDSYWLPPVSRSQPEIGTGDIEFMTKQELWELCSGTITKINCYTEEGVSYTKTGDIVECTPSHGLVCSNSRNNHTCQDYIIRYFCDCSFIDETQSTTVSTSSTGKSTQPPAGTPKTTMSSTGTTPSGGNTGTTPSGGNTGATPSGGNTGTTPSGGNTGTTPSDGNTRTTSGGNTGTATSGGNTGTTSGGNTGTTPSGGNTETTSGGNTETTPSGRNTATTYGGNTGTTSSGGSTGSTPSGGNTETTPPGGNTGTTVSGENTETTPSSGNTVTTTSGRNTGTTPSGGNTGQTSSGGSTGTTTSGGNTGTTTSGRNTGTTSGGNTGTTPLGGNTGTTTSGENTGSTSGGNTGTTSSGGSTGSTPSGRNTETMPSGGNTGTTTSGENTETTPSGGNTGTTPSVGNTGTTPSGGNTGQTSSGGSTGTTTSGGNTGTTSGRNTGTTPLGGNTGTTPLGGNTGTTTSGENTRSTSGGNTGTTPSGGNTGTTSGGNTETTSGGNTGTTSGGNTGTTPSGGNTGSTSGGNTGTTPSVGNTGTTPSGRNTGTTSGRNTGTTPSGGNTGSTSGGNTGTTKSGENTGTTTSGGNTGTTTSGQNTGTTTSGGNTGTTTSGENTGPTSSGGNTGTTPSGGKTGPTSGGNTGTTTSDRNTGTTTPDRNTGTTTSGRNTGTTTSGGNTGTTTSGENTGPTSSGGNTETTPSGGNTETTPSGGKTVPTSGGNTGTTPSGGNTGTTSSGRSTGTTPSDGNTGTSYGRSTGTTSSGRSTGTTPSSGEGTSSSTRSSTFSSATSPSTETSSMSTLAPVCISRWSEWIDRNTDTRLIGDRERLDPHVLSEFCPGGRITNILCYDTVTNQDYRTFSDQSECSIAKGFVCRNKADPPGQPSCRNYKIRYQCDCGDTTPPTYTTVAPTTHKIQVRCGWSPWLNADSPKTGSGDMETISALKKTFGVCQAITDIDCRVAGTATSSGTAGQNGITCDVYNGLRCYNSDAKEGHCFDYEVRLLCWDESCEGKSTPRRAHTTPEPTTSTTVICPPGNEWQSCAYRCSDVCNYRGMKAGACENPAIDDCIPGCKPINSKVTCKYHERLNEEEECVDRQMCPCLKPDGTPALPYDTWVNPDAPCSKCSCIMNEIVCGHDQGSCGTTPEPTPPPTPGVCGLTPWMNGDGPKTGDGDLELIPSLRKKYGFCSSPSVIQCRDAVSKKDVKDIGQDVTCGLSEGLKCFNYNNDGGCLDYEIRLLCPCNNLSSTPTVITPPQTTRKTYDCGWTNWMSNHVNNTAGDTEDIPHLRKKYKFCDTDAIVNIQCREKATALTLTDDESDVICDMYSGLICFNSIRESGTCPDYEVRYMCDAIGSDCSKLEPTGPAPTPSGVYPTPTPGGNPEPICDTELGLRNGDIPEYRITTSSFRDTMHSPKYLRFEGRSSWMPYYSNRKQYVQIDFGVNNVIVTGIKTEGNTAAGTFVKTFKVLHSEDGTTWTTVKDHKHRDQVFKNKDGLPATTYFDLPVRARYIRVNPLSWRGMISLRMELVGCPYTVPTPGVPEVTATTPTVITTFVSTGKPHIKTTSPPQYPDNCVNWYPWINKHRPTFNDTDDKEPVDDFLDDTPGCSHVVAIECRTATPDHTPYNSTGQDVDCNTWNGLKCTSDKSGHQMCYDYEARIGCLKNTPKCLHPPSEIPPCYAGMDTSHCPKAGCAAGLYCNGTQCVQKSECPCILDKTVIVANGLIRSKDCETCQCLNGEVICVPKVCPNSDCPQGYVGLNTTNCECQCDACSPFEYQCANAVCIPSAMRCDGIVDCIDDEVGCAGTPTPFVPGITTLTGSSTTPTRSSPTVTVIVHNTTLSSGPTASVPSSLSTETTEVNSGSTTEGQRSGSTTPSQKSTTGIMWSTTGGFVKTTMGKSTKPTSHITFGPTGSTLTTGGGEFSSTSHSTFGPTGSTLTTGGGEFSSTSHSTFGPTGSTLTTGGGEFSSTSHSTFGPTGSTLTTGGGEFSSTSHSTFGPTGSTLTTGGGEFSSTSHSTFGPTGSTLTTGGGEFSSTSHSTFGPTGSTLTTGGGEFSSTSHSTFGPTGSTLTGGKRSSPSSDTTASPTASVSTPKYSTQAHCAQVTCAPLGKFHMEEGITVTLEKTEDGCCQRYSVCNTSECKNQQTNCSAPYISVAESRKHCCPQYHCECPTSCPRVTFPTCKQGFQPHRIAQDCNCFTFVCTPVPSLPPADCSFTVADNADTKTYKVNETWTVGACKTCKCNLEGEGQKRFPEVSCTEKECKTCKKGEKLVNKTGDCCGECVQVGCMVNGVEYQAGEIIPTTTKCRNTTCEKDPVGDDYIVKDSQVKCPDEETLPTCKEEEDSMGPDGCCKKCIPPPPVPSKCYFIVVDPKATKHRVVKSYKVNETWTVGACKTCKCSSGEGEAKYPEVSCIEKECKTCKKGEKLVNKTGDCCGECVQVGCMVYGVEYQAGEIIPTTTKCRNTTCEKDLFGDGYIVRDSPVTCPDQETLPTCKDKEDSKDPDGCCNKCVPPAGNKTSHCNTCSPQLVFGNNKKSVGYFKVKLPSGAVCTNKKPLNDLKECTGYCASQSKYTSMMQGFENSCKCCQAAKTTSHAVKLTCSDGSTVTKSFRMPTTCSCRACSGGAKTPTPNKISQAPMTVSQG